MRNQMIVIERHRYAPELNKFYFIDSDTGRHLSDRIPCPSLSTTREIRAKFYRPLSRRGLFVKLVVNFPEHLGWPPATYAGVIAKSEQPAMLYLKSQLEQAKRRHCLEGTTFTTSLKVIG